MIALPHSMPLARVSKTAQRVHGMEQFQACIGLAVPGRPIRPLVAADRSAEGARHQTGPDQPGATLGPHAIRRRRTTKASSSQASSPFNGTIRPTPQVLASARRSLTQKRSQVLRRQAHSSGHATPGHATPGHYTAAASPASNARQVRS
jgi:hypothetical protein